jgi:hypothetical protein
MAKRATQPADRLSLAEGVAFRSLPWSADALRQTRKLRRQPTTYLYSLRSSRLAELGPLAAALLRHAAARPRIRDLLAALTPGERRRVRSALRLLVRRGVLEPAMTRR